MDVKFDGCTRSNPTSMQDLYKVSLARQSERGLQTVGNGFRTIESKPFVTENENWRMNIVSTQIE